MTFSNGRKGFENKVSLVTVLHSVPPKPFVPTQFVRFVPQNDCAAFFLFSKSQLISSRVPETRLRGSGGEARV